MNKTKHKLYKCLFCSNILVVMGDVETTDRSDLVSRDETKESSYVTVIPSDYSNIPIRIPNWKPEPRCMGKHYPKLEQRIKHLEVQADDVWVASYPKSGTTWMQEMVWLICNDLNYVTARHINLDQRFPFLEIGAMLGIDSVKVVEDMISPRFVKTHLPVALLPEKFWTVKPKLVYVYRKVKSVAVSFYHHYKTIVLGYRGTQDEFIRSFMNDAVTYAPYHQHVIEYNELSHLDNILLVSFEDMKKDLNAVARRVCAFFDKSFTDQQIVELCEHLSFASMKKNPSVNRQHQVDKVLTADNRLHERDDANRKFIRKGEADGWKNELTEAQAIEIDEWTRSKVTAENHLKFFL